MKAGEMNGKNVLAVNRDLLKLHQLRSPTLHQPPLRHILHLQHSSPATSVCTLDINLLLPRRRNVSIVDKSSGPISLTSYIGQCFQD